MERSIFNRKLQRAMAKILKRNKKPNILLGIGYNSDRFLQITKMHNRFDLLLTEIAEMDYTCKYELPYNKPISIRNTNMNVIIGVHDRNYQEISDSIKREFQCTNDFNI